MNSIRRQLKKIKRSPFSSQEESGTAAHYLAIMNTKERANYLPAIQSFCDKLREVSDNTPITFKELQEIALKNKEGFTIDIYGKPRKSGIAVAVTNGMGGINTLSPVEVYNAAIAHDGELHIGGWVSPEGKMVVDAVKVFSQVSPTILTFAKTHGQYSIFDLDSNTEIIIE